MSLLCYDVSVRLSVTEVHWHIIANLGFKFRSKFTTHCGCSPQCTCMHCECGRIVVAVHARNTVAAPDNEVEAIIRSPTNMAATDVAAVEGRGSSRAVLATARPSC